MDRSLVQNRGFEVGIWGVGGVLIQVSRCLALEGSLVLFDGSPKRIYRPVSGPSLNTSY